MIHTVTIMVEAVEGDELDVVRATSEVRRAIDHWVEGAQTFDLKGPDAPEGAKGWLEIAQAIGVVLLEAGAIKALFDCLVSVVRSSTQRKIKIIIKMPPPAQQELTLQAEGVSQAELDALLEKMERMVERGATGSLR